MAVSYALGAPRAATARGGDCRAHDLGQARNVVGPHVFGLPSHARISNGLVRLTVGVAGGAVSFAFEAFRPAVATEDYYSDIYSDIYEGELSTPGWQDLGFVVVDTPTVATDLDGVRLASVSPEAVCLQLLSFEIGDAFVVLRRGFRTPIIQHGRTRPPFVVTDRRVAWVASPAPTGTASTGRVEEMLPVFEGFPRFVASADPATITGFTLTAPAVRSAEFAVGVGVDADFDRVHDQHAQMTDATKPHLVLAPA